ncbi:MAG: hypothetical protein ABTQ29_15665 [Siculibacillus sp.]
MLVMPRRLPVTLAILALAATSTALSAVAAERPGSWTQAALDASSITREDADRAFASAPPSEAVDPTAPIARVDESALRYYASQHATSRVDAEIRRLRALYPGWEPPADLYKPAGSDEQALWELYGKNRIDDLKLEIERRAARQPGWRPSQDMVEKLRRKEMRIELIAAADKADWQAVLKLADREPLLVGTGDLDVLWRIAEASSRTGSDDRALELYRLALTGATNPAERLGTVRKAIAVMGTDKTASLLSEERPGPGGKGEFEPLRLDLARARIGEWLRPDAARPLPEADLARLVAAASQADGVSGDAALLGWVEHRRKNAAEAIRWFDLALARGGDGKAALGAVLARDSAGRHAEALDLAAGRADDAEVGALFLDLAAADLTSPRPPAIPAERLARFATLTEKLESGDAAQALAWYAFSARQYAPARAWFTKAMAWRPSVKSAEGHLRSLLALNDREAFARLEVDYRGRFPDLPQVRPEENRTRAAVAKAAPRRSCPALVAERVMRPDTGSSADALAAGWCLMDMKRAEEAAVAFQAARRASDQKAAAEAAYGQALAHLRSGRTEDAARVAASGGLVPGRREEIGRIVLAQQAIALFDRGDYRSAVDTLDRRRAHAEEPRDLMSMRAWALYHLGRRSEAFELFGLLDAQLSTRESRAGLAATGPLYRRS